MCICTHTHTHTLKHTHTHTHTQVRSVVEMAAYEGAPSDDRRLSAQLWVQVIGGNNLVYLCCGTHFPSACAGISWLQFPSFHLDCMKY